jgi:gamma-glutamyl-gamma-aminobutyrate hydrolase PuuD
MKRAPRVVVVSRRLERKNKWIDWVSEVHLSLLHRQGLVPVMVPVVPETRRFREDYGAGMAGLLMVEGGDVHPSYYKGRTPVAQLDEVSPVKDDLEFWLCREALRRRLPILGICRGLQILNIVYGGTLHGDVQKERGTALPHMDLDHYDTYRHPVRVIPGTPLHRWYGRTDLRVNSYHHQGVRALPVPLQPMAVASDGLVEGLYDPSRGFVVGLQFHPERMLAEYPGNHRVFQEFGRAVKGAAGGR